MSLFVTRNDIKGILLVTLILAKLSIQFTNFSPIHILSNLVKLNTPGPAKNAWSHRFTVYPRREYRPTDPKNQIGLSENVVYPCLV